MNILSLFPLIPLVMMLGLWISKNTRQIHAVMVAGSSALLALAIYLVFHYLGLREAGATDAMLLTDSVVWYAPLNIHYAVGVDGISVAMLLLSAIIVFTGTFASWQMKSDVKAYFLWFCLLSVGVFGFFITVDLFSMFMFYEVALIPMYLLIGVWGSGRKNYSAMKLTLMLMGGSSGSTVGAIKLYRVITYVKAIYRHIKEILSPDGRVIPIKISGRRVSEKEIGKTGNFITLYLVIIAITWIIFCFYGYPPFDSLFSIISLQGNNGLDIGVLNNTLNPVLKIVSVLNMWVGRLEIYPVLVLFRAIFEIFKK